MSTDPTRRTRWILLAAWAIAALCAAGVLIYLAVSYDRARTATREEIHAKARAEAQRTALAINEELARARKLAGDMQDRLRSGEIAWRDLPSKMRDLVAITPEIYGMGVAFAPYAYEQNRRLHAPYHLWGEEGVHTTSIESGFDYICEAKDEPCQGDREHAWYYGRLSSAGWNEPHYDQTEEHRQLVAEYGFPVYARGEEGKAPALGVAVIQVAVDNLEPLLREAAQIENGYSFIVSRGGALLSFPVHEYVTGQKNLFELLDPETDPAARALADRIRAGGSGELKLHEPLRGEPAWYFFEPIPETGFCAVVVSLRNDDVAGDSAARSLLMKITLSSLALLVALLFVLRYVRGGQGGPLWPEVFVASVLFSAAIALIWYLALSIPSYAGAGKEQVIYNDRSLRTFEIQQIRASMRRKTGIPVFVPTGLFVQSVEFLSENNVRVTGYVWTKHTKGQHDELVPGVVFPEAVDVALEEAYTTSDGPVTTRGWYFKVELREEFDMSRYPLDYKNVWVRLWHKDFHKNAILVPDLNAYDLLIPSHLPGIERHFVLSGWSLASSYFGYQMNEYSTNFGIRAYVGQGGFPELYFHVVLQRDFISPFVAHIIPLFVVALIVFIVVISSSRERDHIEIAGFNASTVLSINAALFFGVLLGHIQLREALSARHVFYLENFYFLMYAIIMLSSINSTLLARGARLWIIDYKDNLLFKIMFWPALLGALLAITVYTFH